MYSVLERFGVREMGRNCLFSAIHNALTYQGFFLTESEACLCFNGLNSMYDPAKGKYGLEDIVLHLRKNLISESVQVVHESEGLSVPAALEVLRSNRPALLLLRAKDATYSKILVSSGAPGRHVAVLYGLDTEQDKAYVWDNFVINKLRHVSCFSGSTDLSALQPGILEVFSLKILSKKPFCFSDVLQNSLQAFFELEREDGYFQGETALRRYLEDAQAGMDTPVRMRAKSYEVYFTLRVCTVEIFMQSLTDCMDKLRKYGFDDFSSCRKELYHLRDAWDRFAVKLLRMGMKNRTEELKGIEAEQKALFSMQKETLYHLLDQLKWTKIVFVPQQGRFCRMEDV